MIVLSSLELTYNNYIKYINSGQEEDVALIFSLSSSEAQSFGKVFGCN